MTHALRARLVIGALLRALLVACCVALPSLARVTSAAEVTFPESQSLEPITIAANSASHFTQGA